jgi:sugar lactone lactonase YvrE
MTTALKQRLETRIGKVLSHQKARGGFSTALAYDPDDNAEREHGSLYFVIDIGSPSPLTADIAYNLIDIIKEEYYSDLELSASESFENALKAANDELSAIAKQGEKDWIGKFNAVVAAVRGREVHIVQRGTAEMHLLRNGSITNLSKGMYTPGETYRPEETLTNLIEGEIEVSDKLILTTSELFYYVSLEKLKRLMDNHTPAAAAKKLATLLEQEQEINHTSVLISEFSLPELLAQEEETEPSENWVGTPAEPQPRRTGLFGAATPTIDKERTVEQAIEQPELEPEPEPEEVEEEPEEEEYVPRHREELVIDETQEGGDEPTETYKVRMPQIKLGKPSFDGFKGGINLAGEYASKLKIDSKQLNRAGQITWQLARVAGAAIMVVVDWAVKNITRGVRIIKRHPKGNQILIGIVALLAIVIVTSTIGLSRGATTRVGGKKATVALAEAQQKRDAAQAALIYEDGVKARSLLAEAYALAQSATSNRKTKDQATALVAELEKQLDTVSNVKRYNDIQPLADFGTLASQLNAGSSDTPKQVKIGQITVLGGNVYAVDPDNNKVYKFKSTSGDVAIANSLVSNDRKLKLVSPASDKELIFYTTPPNVYSLNLDNNSLTGKALDAGNWANADQFVAYTDKLYFLDTQNNNVWKYRSIPEGYTKIAPYFETTTGLNLAGALDFAIDGNVFILMPGNVVKKYTGGSEAQFNLNTIPSPYPGLGNATQIYADANTNLYVLDIANNRVVMFDKEGAYLAQFVYGSGISNPTNLFVDQANNFIYLTAGTALYRLPMK